MGSHTPAAGGRDEGPLVRFLVSILPWCLVLTLGIGIGKVYLQKAIPPVYAKPSNTYQGYVSIDWQSTNAAALRKWFSGDDPGGEEARQRFANDLHPTAVAVPAMVAGLDLLVGDIPVSFLILSASALPVLLVAAYFLARAAAPGVPAAPLLAVTLICSHCLTVRTCAQLILDTFCTAWTVVACLLTVRWIRRPALLLTLGFVGLQILGILTKVSYAPMLAAPFLAIAWSASAKAMLGRAIQAALAFSIVPFGLWFLFLSWLAGLSAGTRETQHLVGQWSLSAGELLHFGVEMALLFQGFALALFLKPNVWNPATRVVAVAMAAILLGTWLFRLPAVPRLYLPVVPCLAILCAPKLIANFSERALVGLVSVYLIANYGVAAIGLAIETLARA